MQDVFIAEGMSFAVFEPFLRDLVAAKVEVPDVFRYSGKSIALFVDDYVTLLIFGMSSPLDRHRDRKIE